MKDLCAATGLPRQAIHFYIQQGLLPPAKKTGRNTALYSNDHLERLKTIRRLQHERFLPLRAIKALLLNQDDAYSPTQRRFLQDVRGHLTQSELRPAEQATVDLDSVIERAQADRADIDEAIEVGILGSLLIDGKLHIAEDDVWMIDELVAMRSAGFTRELGFTMRDLLLYQETVTKLVNEEAVRMLPRLAHLSPDAVAKMLEQVLPVVHRFLVRTHTDRVRDIFNSF